MILKNIQGLRGIAALMVCLFHLIYLMNNKTVEFFSAFGFVGVDIFFVISGILMVLTTQKVKGSALNNMKMFLVKRLIRIIPLYYITTVLWILMTHRFGYYFHQHNFQLIEALFFFPVPTYTPNSIYPYPPLYVGWSLNYEMFFYFIFAVGFLYKSRRYFFICITLGFLVFVIPLFEGETFLQFFNSRFAMPFLLFYKNPILLFFLAGVLMGNMLPFIKLKYSTCLWFLLFSVILFSLYYFQVISNNFITRLSVSILLVFSVILCDQRKFKIPTPYFIQYLGNISYSIYLIHPIVLIYLPGIIKKFGSGLSISSFYFFIIFFVVLLVISTILYEIVEKRLTAYLRQKLLQTSRLQLSVGT